MNELSDDEIIHILSFMQIDDAILCIYDKRFSQLVQQYIQMYTIFTYPQIQYSHNTFVKKLYRSATRCMMCNNLLTPGMSIVTLICYPTHATDVYKLCNFHITCLEPNHLIVPHTKPSLNNRGRMAIYKCPFTDECIMGFKRYHI